MNAAVPRPESVSADVSGEANYLDVRYSEQQRPFTD